MPKNDLNVTLKGIDELLFSTEEQRQEEKREQVQQIPIDELHPFTNHPFKVVDDEAMTRTVESIAQFGVLAPLIARPRPDGDGYEIISGHRRQFAAKMAGLETLPVIVRDMDTELKGLLSEDEYAAARSSVLNAHYTSPTVIRAIYDAVEKMGFRSGNILEPSMGVGNFFGMLPNTMQDSRLYGVELDSITGRIAQKLYPEASIKVAGFETTDRRDFYDLAVGNVPFGQYRVNDKAYNKLGFSISFITV